jgi:predicted extracellular nuclease
MMKRPNTSFAAPTKLDKRHSKKIRIAKLAVGKNFAVLAVALGAAMLLIVGSTRIRRVSALTITTLGTPITQNFDTLVTSGTANAWADDSSLPGWYAQFSLQPANPVTYRADSGASNTGAIYSWGVATTNPLTERAFGSIASGTPGDIFIALKLTNDTGSTITSLDISYTGEQWRAGGCTPTPCTPLAQTLDFQYQVANMGAIADANTPTTGWTDFNALDFTTPTPGTSTASALDGNAAANRTSKSANLPVTVNAGQEIWIRWKDINDAGNDHGLAIDDFSVTANGSVVTPTLNIGDVTQAEGDAGTTTFNFLVSLSAPAGAGGVNFTVNTQDGSTNPANAGSDYVAIVNGSGSISMDNTSTMVNVTVNGDMTPEPNETFFVNISNITGANAGDVQGLGTINNDDVTLTPIHDIQGPGASSPLSGSVTTRGVVTGVKSNGFFIQEPDATVDANPLTSEGIFVFTSSAPPAAAAVGNSVQVTGTISEFVPSADPQQPPLTELTGPTVLLLSSGNPLPAAIPLSPTFPDPTGTFDQLERVEGMRASVGSFTVVGPTLGNVNEPNATATSTGVFFGVVTGVARPFREPGIQAPDNPPSGTIPPIPRFDTNPETIRVDSDGLVGGTLLDVKTGAAVTGLVGPVDYGFRKYTILPEPASPLSVNNSNAIVATAVTTPASNEFTVASYNLERFFDTVNDPNISEPVLTAAAFNNRLAKASLGIRNFLRFPDILGVVEVENLTTLQALAVRISSDAVANGQPDPMYMAYLSEGNDVGGIDVGFLIKRAPVAGMTPRVTVNAVVQENLNEMWVDPADNAMHLLNDRPPLRLDAIVNHPCGSTFPVTVIVNHLRSLNGVDSNAPDGLTTEGDRVRKKRLKQAESLANLVQLRQTANPIERIILVGDFNAFEFNDGYGDSMGVIQGTPAPDNQTVVPGDGVDLVNPDLSNLFDTAPANERYSFVFDGNAQSLDHILVNQALIGGTVARRVEHPRINADFPETARNGVLSMEMNVERLADHDPIVAFFSIAVCMITCPPNKTQSNDPNQCGAVVTYNAPTTAGACNNVVCSPASGSFFPVGTTTVTCKSNNGAGPEMCTFTVTVLDTQAPSITCPAPVTAVAAQTCPLSTTTAVTFPDPTASDNCPGVTVACVPPSGSTFPAGTTTVTCTATDASGNTASCSFTVSVFSACLQDDSVPTNVVLFNLSGEYRFCCNGMTFSGTGIATVRGCVASIQHNPPDRRVLLTFDGALHRGTASLQSPPGTIKCTIIDRNTMNNTCACQ